MPRVSSCDITYPHIWVMTSTHVCSTLGMFIHSLYVDHCHVNDCDVCYIPTQPRANIHGPYTYCG